MNDETVAIRKLGSKKQEIIEFKKSLELLMKEAAAPDFKN